MAVRLGVWPSFAFAAGDPDRGFRVVVPRASVSRVCGRHRATCFSMSGVSGVSGALGNECASVVVSTDKPVFSDDSGIRAAVLKWGVWAICLIAVLLGGALVLTLRTHVALPGWIGCRRHRADRSSARQCRRRRNRASRLSRRSHCGCRSHCGRPSRSGQPTPSRARRSKRAPTVKRAAPTADATSAPQQERPPRPLVPPPALKKRRWSATPRRRIRPHGVRGRHRSLAMVQDEFNA